MESEGQLAIYLPLAKDCTAKALLSVLNQVDFVCNEYTQDLDLESVSTIDHLRDQLNEAVAVLKTDAPFEQTIGARVDLTPASNSSRYYVSVNLFRNVGFAVLSVELWSGKFYGYQQAFEIKKKVEQHFYW